MPLDTSSGAHISPIAIKQQMKIKTMDEQEIEKIQPDLLMKTLAKAP